MHTDQTRHLILAAFAECLEERSSVDISVANIAAKAGVAEKTVYRHFPTRVELLAAFGSWSREHVMSLIPVDKLTDLPQVYSKVAHRFEEQPRMTRAIALSDVGRQAFSGLEEDVVAMFTDRVREANPALTPRQVRHAVAALSFLDSPYSWVKLTDSFAMDATEIAEVIGWVMTLVIHAITPEGDQQDE